MLSWAEPYDHSSRRGRKEPEVVAAASVKRLFLQNMPYLVGGYCLQYSLTRISEVDNIVVGSKISSGIQNRTSNHGSSISILSMADKYKHMRETFRKRLAFGEDPVALLLPSLIFVPLPLLPWPLKLTMLSRITHLFAVHPLKCLFSSYLEVF